MILLFLFVFLLPTQLGKHFFFDFSYISGIRIDYLSPTLYLTDLLAISLIIVHFDYIVAFVKKYIRILLIIICLTVLNIFFAENSLIALYKFIKYVELISIFIIFKNVYIRANYFSYALVGSVAMQLFLAVLQIGNKQSIQGIFYFFGERYLTLSTPDIAKVSLQGVEVLRAYGTFSHPNSLAGFFLLIYAFTLFYKPFNDFKLQKTFITACSTLIIFLSFSKITIGLLLLFTIFYFTRIQKGSNCLICSISRLFGILVLAFVFSSAQGDPLSFEKRWILNQNALTIILQNPLLGVGLGNYLYEQAVFPIKYSYHFLQPVHNIFLLFVSEAGLILSGYIGYILVKRRKIIFSSQPFLYCFLLVMLTGMFDHYWLTLQQNMFIIPVLFGLLQRKDEAKV